MSNVRVEVAVVGTGLMGAATAWELTRRGALRPRAPARDRADRADRAYADPFYDRLTRRGCVGWGSGAGRSSRVRRSAPSSRAGRAPWCTPTASPSPRAPSWSPAGPGCPISPPRWVSGSTCRRCVSPSRRCSTSATATPAPAGPRWWRRRTRCRSTDSPVWGRRRAVAGVQGGRAQQRHAHQRIGPRRPGRPGHLPLHHHPERRLPARPGRPPRARVPCSGHGAKFAPLVGATAADLALGEGDTPSRFAWRQVQARP